MLSDEQLMRYNRQLLLEDFDIAGQERLLAAKVLILGMGGLGSPAALYLAAAGVGELVLVDFDDVELSNLQRQIVHRDAAIGEPKVDSARETLRALNPGTRVTTINRRLSGTELRDVVAGVDIVNITGRRGTVVAVDLDEGQLTYRSDGGRERTIATRSAGVNSTSRSTCASTR